MKQFTLNGNRYNIKTMNVNMLCDFEDVGISMSDMQKKSFSFIRAYIASCTGFDAERAGRELELHLTNGGSLDEIMDAIKIAMDDSDFFRAISKTSAEETPESKTETKK